jgi:hypothetical protein
LLRSVKELHNYVLAADDGDVGRCRDFLFDDTQWTIRYMVADTGKWLPKRTVLISPMSLGTPDWASQLFRVNLTRKKIEESPELDSNAPVSREYENKWFEYHGWAPYWYAGGITSGIWGAASTPRGLAETDRRTTVVESTEAASHNLRSTGEVTGYHIQAVDGEIGHVEDFIMGDETWAIRYVVIDTRNWLRGKKVLIAPTWVGSISWADRKMHVEMTRAQIKEAPEFDAAEPINRVYEDRLHDYYGRPKYWR